MSEKCGGLSHRQLANFEDFGIHPVGFSMGQTICEAALSMVRRSKIAILQERVTAHGKGM